MAIGHLPPGKLPVGLLVELLGELGPAPPEVRLGPAVGEDACVLEVQGGALVVATDPITFTGIDIGWLAVVVNANDVAVTGVRPRWFLAVVLLPRDTTDDDVRTLFAGMREALAEVGVTLVGGHTEVTPVVSQPIIVGQMLGLAENGRFVTTGGAREGDVVVQVGLAPIEGAAVLAVEAAEHLGDCDPATVGAAADAIHDPGISVVEAALAAAELGATALHDPTEGGLASGLHELATAAGLAVRVDPARVRWFEPGLAVCRALGADPWATLASGSLLATFPPDQATIAARAIAARGYPVATLGAAESGEGVHTTDGRPIPWPERDEVARLLS